MFVGLYVRMFYILILCPVLLASGGLTLTIDSQLGTSVEDCFDRISIGEQLPRDTIYRNVTELTTVECEQICKQDKQCQAYDYGVGAKGNATCDLSNVSEKEIKEKNLYKKHPDYDVYVRRFLCEQSPPTPIDQPFDNSNNESGSQHRPVVRPTDDDAKRPLSDDLNPYESSRPQASYSPNRPYRPGYNQFNDRPDDYGNWRPDNDRPPSYGDHKPQDIPYRPERPYRNTSRPDPYDQLYLQDPYKKPRPGLWRPDPYHPPQHDDEIQDIYGPGGAKPQRPEYIPEKPQYQYIIRPSRKPYPKPEDQGYNQASQPSDGYGSGYPGPIVPPSRPYKPTRPYDKPTYTYTDQYASNYGTSQDNSIYLEIYDPPRPYSPGVTERPYYGAGSAGQSYGQNYGYNSFSNQNSYSQSQQQYGSNSWNYGSQKPQKPGYGSGSPSLNDDGYGNRPVHKPKPSYDSYQHSQSSHNQASYGESYASNQQYYNQGYGSTSGYGTQASNTYGSSQNQYAQESHSSSQYGSSQSSYDNQISSGQSRPSSQYGQSGYGEQSASNYGQSNQQYGSNQDKTQFTNTQSGYGNQATSSYGGSNQYGSNQDSQNNKYSNTQSGYGNQALNSFSSQSSQYGSNQHSQSNKYGSNQSGYGNQAAGGYGGQSSQYGSSLDSQSNKYTSSQGGYGNQATSGYGGQSSQYGSTSDSQSNKYTSSQGGYGNQVSTGYGEINQQYGSQQGYQNNKVTNIQSGYGQASSVGSQSNQYGSSQSGYGNQASNSYESSQSNQQYGSQSNQYNTQSSYGNQVSNNYGESLNLDYSNYHGSHLGYGIHHLYGIKPGSYENDPQNYRPLITDNKPNKYIDRPNYQDRPSQDSQSTGYGDKDSGYKKPDTIPSYDQDRPGVKPVYEQDIGKPNGPNYIIRPNGDVVTSKPVAVGQFGRDPGKDISYEACYRRVLAGKRALRSHVRRVIDCERLEDCMRECATERRFHCESFNYRLDPSFRGKGLCELMTKPIEAFDLREDFVEDKNFDFYEVDRNSLEPYCPETLRGPSLLHSGFLSSKPAKVPGQQNHWRDRMDYSEGYKSYNRFYDEKRTQSYNRHHEDQFYVPYQIGVSRINDDQENYGQYGGYYGGYDSYYKDRNDYHKSINHWRLSDERKYNEYHGVRHQNDERDFDYHSLRKQSGWEEHGYGHGSWKRGRWNSSGSFWKDHDGETNLEHNKQIYFESEGRTEDTTKDCSSRRRPGMSLGTGAIRRSLNAHTVVECEAACFNEREFKCVSYSYRYSSSPGSDNCFLSERPYRGLEMSADSDSDVYAMPLHQDCLTISTKPWVESECFWHVRSGSAVTGKAVRAALTVTGLGACEAECIRAHSFFCRGFSFRFDAPTIGDDLENCILTSSPPTSLDVGHGLRPSKHELYARGNYGRGCEPALYDDVNREPQCYLQYDGSAKLSAGAVRGTARAQDERACGRACTDAPFRCLSFSFSTNASPDGENCLLSEIRMFDLQRGVDYTHSSDDLLFAFDLFNGQCWRKVHGKEEYDVPTLEVPHPMEGSFSGPPSGPSDLPPSPPETYISSSGPSGPGYPEPPKPYSSGTGPGFKPGYEISGPPKPYPHDTFKPSYLPESGPSGPSGPGILSGPSGPSGLSGPSGPSGPPLKPGYDYEPNSKPSYAGPYRPVHKPVAPDRKPGYLSDPIGPGYKPSYGPPPPTGQDFGYRPPRPVKPVEEVDESLSLSWRHYTVSGFPCRKGTSCEQNIVAGHWACEPEAGEIGSWDYCCAPTHRCGYSEGFQKPWCYVGPAHDQWRPCSEKYYPYHKHKVPHPSQGHREAIQPRPERPTNPLPERDRLSSKPNYDTQERDRRPGTYLPEADRRYWDDLYKNGPQAYYDKHGNPLPGYTRVPTEERPHIKYQHNPPKPGSGYWVPVNSHDEEDIGGGLGVPRYWPVAYLHKGPPPNMTYFRYNETVDRNTPASSNRQDFKRINAETPFSNDVESRSIDDRPRSEKRINITNNEGGDILALTLDVNTTTVKPQVNHTKVENVTEKHDKNVTQLYIKPEIANLEEDEFVKGIDGKLHDFTRSIEVYDIEDVKCDKIPDTKTVEAEEKQIEAIGRILASRRNGKLILEKRSQKDLETKNIAVDKEFVDFDFGNRFPTPERRGTVRRVTKDDIEKDKFLNDKSLEVSETSFVRPPRVLSTTENVKKAVVNGKVFYDATIRDQRELYSNGTRRGKNLRLDENRAPLITSGSNKKKTVRTRNTNPIRRVRRVYRKKYNPEEVRKRLLEREKNKNGTDNVKL